MISYLHRLHHCNSNLLKEAFLCNKDMHENNTMTWYSSVKFILQKLELKETYCIDYSINRLKQLIMKKLKTLFLKAWFNDKDNVNGKLDTYFSHKSNFQMEKYLDIQSFQSRQILCKFRISAHQLRVEKERHKNKPIERSQRTCNFCSHNDIEDEFHFLINCPLYNQCRESLFAQAHEHCQNFNNLDCKSKFLWLMTTEDQHILKKLCIFLIQSFELRSTNYVNG